MIILNQLMLSLNQGVKSKMMRRVKKVQQGMSNTNIELKKMER